MIAPRQKTPFQLQREAIADTLVGMARQLEELVAKAQDPGTPEHAELSVRRSMRIAEAIARRAVNLRAVRDPTPWITAPTRERERQAGEDAKKGVVLQNGVGVGVNHRWVWPVQRAQQNQILRSHHVLAAARFRRAYDDLGRPGTMRYDPDRAPSDPTRRNPLTIADDRRQQAQQPLAAREFGYVWTRLEDELKAVAWVLVFEEALPGESGVLSIVEFGRRIGGMRSEDHARWFAFGSMKMVLVRLATIYKHFDLLIAKEKADAARQGWDKRGDTLKEWQRKAVAESTEKPLDGQTRFG